MFPKEKRLSSALFDRTFRDGKRVSSAFFGLIFQRVLPNEPSKFAVIVSKKAAPNATDRNKLRRRVYATLRTSGINRTAHGIVIVQIKKGAENLSAERRQEEIKSLFAKIV